MTRKLKWQSKLNLIALDEIDSTNSEAKRMALAIKAPEYRVIWAKRQTSGRGKYGKNWESLEGNLFCSIILPRTASLDIMAQLSFVSALAVENAIASVIKNYPATPSILLKWPNDILLNNKKVAGILLETAGKGSEYIIVGIGINILTSPDITEYPTTSLYAEGAHFVSRENMLNKVMHYFLKFYQLWLSQDFIPIREQWIKKAKGIGSIINITNSHSRMTGKFIDIDFKGALRLQVSSGQICSIHAGDIFFL